MPGRRGRRSAAISCRRQSGSRRGLQPPPLLPAHARQLNQRTLSFQVITYGRLLALEGNMYRWSEPVSFILVGAATAAETPNLKR
jgi:hypothetical protein